MAHEFDRDYWDAHWTGSAAAAGGEAPPVNPHLVAEVSGLTPGTALEAGCGEGAEAVWLAGRGWQVTAVDLSSAALERAAQHARDGDVAGRLRWVEADLTVWDPGTQFDLVTTHYAHPAIPQLAFYDRISRWVAPGGTLLIVGHRHGPGSTRHGHHPPAEASTTVADLTAALDDVRWHVVTATEHTRTLAVHGGQAIPLDDVVVRATRRLE
jgi:SAM-dependent methyltransferase